MSTKKKISTTSISSRAANEGVTQLMYACQQADAHLVKQILQRKLMSLRDRDRTGKSALHYCAENASTECAELLLNAEPSLINAADDDGYTPLHLAVIAGQKIIIRYLISRGADVNFLDAELHSVVHWATVCGEVEALEIVLDAGADPCTPDVHGAYPIHYAAQMCGQKKGITSIPPRDGRLGLSLLKKLISRGVPVDVVDRDGRQPLLWAASSEGEPSKVSCPSGSADAILALVNAGADVNAADKDGLTALHCASSRGHSDCLETLVALCGTDVDLVDSNGCTALFYAVTLGHADCAQLLLNYGANPNHQDNRGRTPAHCGASKGQMETLRLLVHHGGDVWIRNSKGDLALHEAVASGRKDLTLWMLRQRSSAANLANNDGRCPIHVAAISNNIEMCKILIDHEAEINCIMRANRGQLLTPLDAALRRGNRSCAKFLQLHGALPAAKLTDSKALQRALSQAFSDSQRTGSNAVTVNQHDDYPSMTDSQLSTMSSVLQAPQFKPILRSYSRLEDSSTQTQVEESFYGEYKDAQVQLTSADLRYGETESSLRRRRTRRRANRRSLTEPRPPPNDEEVRWKSRQRNSYPNDSDVVYSETDDENEQSYGRRFRHKGDHAQLVGDFVVNYDSSDVNGEGDNGGEAAVIEIVQVEAVDCNTNTESVLSNLGTEGSGQKDSGFSDVLCTERTPRMCEGDPGGPSGEDPSCRIKTGTTEVSQPTDIAINPSNRPAINENEVIEETDRSTAVIDRLMKNDKESVQQSRGILREGQRINERPLAPVRNESIQNQWNNNVEKSKVPNMNAPYPSIIETKSKNSLLDGTLTQNHSITVRRIVRNEEELPALIIKSARSVATNQDHQSNTAATMTTGAMDNSTPRTMTFSRSFRKPSRLTDDGLKAFHLRRSKSERLGRQSESIDDDSRFKSDPFSSMSVTRATQMRTRRYHLERKIFQQLLELKQMQIRCGQSNEQVYAKRLIDSFRKDSVTVGLRPYDGTYSFTELENYLYDANMDVSVQELLFQITRPKALNPMQIMADQLRLVQGGHQGCLPLVDGEDDNQKGAEFQCTLPTSSVSSPSPVAQDDGTRAYNFAETEQ